MTDFASLIAPMGVETFLAQHYGRQPAHIRGGAMRVLHLACGSIVDVDAVCSACGRPLNREDERWIAPWWSDDPIELASPVS